ncbi:MULTISPECIES: hypothetical protein [unclassified Streptomyces]
MNVAHEKIQYVAAGAEELFPWFAIMFGILLVVPVVGLLKTRHR